MSAEPLRYHIAAGPDQALAAGRRPSVADATGEVRHALEITYKRVNRRSGR